MRLFVVTIIGLAALAVAGCGQPVQARSDGWDNCAKDARMPPADRIAACTEAIDSGVLKGEKLGLALYLRGYARNQGQDYTGAMTDLDAAMALRPRDIAVLVTRSVALSALRRPDEAIAQLDKALVLQPGSSEALNGRCWIRAEFDRELNKAMADCNAALEASPDSPAFLDSRGLVNLRAKRWDAAIADYTAALETAPELPWALYGRGIALIRKGDVQSGKADLEAGKASWPGVEAAFDAFGIKP